MSKDPQSERPFSTRRNPILGGDPKPQAHAAAPKPAAKTAPDAGDLDYGPTLRGLREGMKVFGRYELRRMLGRGGMGVVWLARDAKLDLEVALKFLPEDLVHDEVALDDLRRETRRCMKLTHQNIVHVYDLVHDASTAAIAMEFIDGKSLSVLRLEQPGRVFAPEALSPFLREVCEALTYAHEKGQIIHRDLKPANIMIDSQTTLKVMDFGIASSISDSVSRLSRAGAPSAGGGTLPYMSPQQLLGYPPGVSDDVYSLGATIYELLTGKPPFFRGELSRQIESIVPPSMAERRRELEVQGGDAIPEAWEKTVAACLDKEVEKRPKSAAHLWSMLGGTMPPAAGAAGFGVRRQAQRDAALGGAAPAAGARSGSQGDGTLLSRAGEEASVPAAYPKRRRGAAVQSASRTSLVAGGIVALLMLGSAAGWWFGIEQPRRAKETRLAMEKAAAEARQRADAEAARATKQKTDADEKLRLAKAESARLAKEKADAEEQARRLQAQADAARMAKETADAARRKAESEAEDARQARESAQTSAMNEQRAREEAEQRVQALSVRSYYSAIAYSRSTGNSGWATGRARLEEAQGEAVKQCNAQDATSVIWAKGDNYCALAVGSNRAAGWAAGATASEARSSALAGCSRHCNDARIVTCIRGKPE